MSQQEQAPSSAFGPEVPGDEEPFQHTRTPRIIMHASFFISVTAALSGLLIASRDGAMILPAFLVGCAIVIACKGVFDERTEELRRRHTQELAEATSRWRSEYKTLVQGTLRAGVYVSTKQKMIASGQIDLSESENYINNGGGI